jgi:hypothetical protein
MFHASGKSAPSRQLKHWSLPPGDDCVVEQSMQEVAAACCEYFPAAQAEQAIAVLLEKRPGVQDVQLLAATPLYDPKVQLLQTEKPVWLNFPASQF